jgi:hypothetical protein
MSQKTTIPEPAEVGVKKRLILAPQSAGRIGKSTAAEAILSWMEFADLDCALFDLDEEHRTISQRYPDLATVFPEAIKHDDGWAKLMTAVVEVEVPTILCDLPAQSTGFLLKQLIEREGLRLWDAAGIRLTLLIFPAKDAAARESAIECVKVLGDRVDWLVIRQPGPKPLVDCEEWANSKLGVRLKQLGALEMSLPRITTSALEAVEKSAKAAGRWLSMAEAIGKVGMVAQHELELWRNRALVGCEDAARILIPDSGLIQKRTIRLKAPAIYRKSEGPIFDL